MKVAIVHDYLNQMGGAEKVVEVFHEMFPKAPIYTSIYVPDAVSPTFRKADVRTSFMQRLPFIKTHGRTYLAFYPYAIELFDLSEYDLVLSSSSAFAKGVITKPETCHVCYCYTPMRFAWNYHSYMRRENLSRTARTLLPYIIHRLRRWDEITANRVDYYIAISTEIARRIRKYYRRASEIIFPPVNVRDFRLSTKDDGYFAIISRLLPYKNIDVAIQAFNQLRLPLKIVGGGRDQARLKKLAGPTVELLGRLPQADMLSVLENCRALVFPGCEDFGLTPVEAMACGKPVIALAAGGALETVVEGMTGTFFDDPTSDAIAEAVRIFDPADYSPEAVRAYAETFDVAVFKEKIRNFFLDKLEQHRADISASGLARGTVLKSIQTVTDEQEEVLEER